MLSFYISKCLDEHKELYGAIIIQIGDNLSNSLCDIYAEMAPNNFGRIMAYLTLVYKFADSLDEETTREAVRRTVQNLKLIDLEKYKVKRFISFKALLGRQLLRLFCDVMCHIGY